MNAISKKKLKNLGLRNSNEIARAANTKFFIEHQKMTVEAPAAWWVMKADGEIIHEVAGAAKDTEALDSAKQFAADEFLIFGGWEQDPFGGWHPSGTLAAAVANVDTTSIDEYL